MVFVENTGQIQLTQPFGQWISKYAADERFSRYLEVGTWNGRGSTCCFYDGFCKRTTSYSLQSYEINLQRATEAKELWKQDPRIEIYHGRMLENHECPVYCEVCKVHPQIAEAWHTEDIQHFWAASYVPMKSPEVVLLDGAEYLTYFEFQKLKHMSSIQVFLLDDTHTSKCSYINAYLQSSPDWKRIAYSDTERNGWAVFERVTASSAQTLEIPDDLE
jgi:hypothetical protein